MTREQTSTASIPRMILQRLISILLERAKLLGASAMSFLSLTPGYIYTSAWIGVPEGVLPIRSMPILCTG